MTDTIAFRIFMSDNQWKMDRNNEFVAVFMSSESATDAAKGYRAEIIKHGGTATITVVDPDGSERSV